MLKKWIILLLLLIITGCSSPEKEPEKDPNLPLRDNTPTVLDTVPSEEHVEQNEVATLYLDHTSDGYIMLVYTGSNEKVKFQIKAPDEVTYTYLVTDCKAPTAFPLTGGSGNYLFTVYEAVDAENNKYSVAFSYEETDINIENEFLPYLTPNYYVGFAEDSACVSKGKELAEPCYTDLDVISNVYKYVIENVVYDTEEAENVAYGYIPNPDEVLETNKGICFDYASLMTAMLRSQNIPSKLEVGYAGDVYHAWISCFVDEIGWVDNIIQFDGEHWSLMDPTLASNNDSEDVQQYIGDGSKYVVKYTY